MIDRSADIRAALRKRQRGFLLNPFRFGGGAGGATSFIAFDGDFFNTYIIGVSTTRAIPAAAQSNDLLLAFVMHRAALTPPSGWTLVAMATCVGGGTTQYSSVYKRTVQAGDAGSSTTWTQAASARMAVHFHLYRRSGGICDVETFATANVNNTTTDRLNWAVATAGSDGGLAAVFASAVIAGPNTTFTPTSGIITSPPGNNDNRIAVAYFPINAGSVTTGYFQRSASQSSDGVASVSVIVK